METKNFNTIDLTNEELVSINGGVVPIAIWIGGGILFIGSVALGYNIGSDIWG